jgi:hypothetical protein
MKGLNNQNANYSSNNTLNTEEKSQKEEIISVKNPSTTSNKNLIPRPNKLILQTDPLMKNFYNKNISNNSQIILNKKDASKRKVLANSFSTSSNLTQHQIIPRNHNTHNTRGMDNSSNLEEEELRQIEKTNQELRTKLKTMNTNLNQILDKMIKADDIMYSAIPQKQFDVGLEEKLMDKEIEISKRNLNNIINDYNKVFKKFFLISDTDYISSLKAEINQTEEEIQKFKTMNKEVEIKIKQNDIGYRKVSKKLEEKDNLKEIQSLDYKINLLEGKISKLRKENILLSNNLSKEEEKYATILEKYNKLIEIVEMYGIDNKVLEEGEKNEKIKQKYEQYIKKVQILEHSRDTMSRNYSNQIINNRKHIDELVLKLQKLEEKIVS